MMMALCAGCGNKGTEEITSENSNAAESQSVYKLTDNTVKKDETVYTNISSTGKVTIVNVTDHLHSNEPQVRVLDVTNLEDFEDVKTGILPVYDNGNMYWDMPSTDLYYTGISKEEPPIDISISYALDGKSIKPEKLSGKSGEVEIKVTVTNNITKTVNGNTLKCPMIFMGGMILPDEQFENIKISNGIVLNEGERNIAVFMGIPGVNESLGLESLGDTVSDILADNNTYTIKAEVENFSMSNMMLTAVPLSSIGALGGEEMEESIEGVKEVLVDLDSMISAISGLGVDEIIQILYGDSDKIRELMSAAADAQELFEENKELLQMLSNFASDENIAIMEKTVNDLNSIDLSGVEGLMDNGLYQQWMNWLSQFSSQISDLNTLMQDMKQLKPMLDELNEELNNEKVQASIDNLPETKKKLENLIKVVEENQEVFDVIEKLSNDETTNQIKSLTTILQKYTGLEGLSQSQADNLAATMKDWLDFGQEYDIFTSKTDKMESSVIYVFKVDSIE